MSRGDRLRARDIIDAINRIEAWVSDKTAAWPADLFRSGVLREMAVIGEAAANISDEFKQAHPEIPWRSIIGFRNKLVHEYWDTAWSIVEDAIRTSLPPLKAAVSEIRGIPGHEGTAVSPDQLFTMATRGWLATGRGRAGSVRRSS